MAELAVVGFVAAVVALAIAGSASQEPRDGIVGLWLVEDGDARVEIAGCGEEALCGRIVWLDDPFDEDGRPRRDVENPDATLRESPVVGLRILTRVPRVPKDDGVWTDARIYDPKSGKTYKCKLELESDGRLKLRGYVGFSLFGRTEHWSRVEGISEGGQPEGRSEWFERGAPDARSR